MLPSEFLDGAARERLRLRLRRFVDAEHRRRAGAAAPGRGRSEARLRGPMHRLGEAIGVLPGEDIPPHPCAAALKPLGVEAGQFAVFLPALLKPQGGRHRAPCCGRCGRMPNRRHCRRPGWSRASPPADWADRFGVAMGWVEAGPVLLRLDIAERIGRELNYLIRKHPVALPPALLRACR